MSDGFIIGKPWNRALHDAGLETVRLSPEW